MIKLSNDISYIKMGKSILQKIKLEFEKWISSLHFLVSNILPNDFFKSKNFLLSRLAVHVEGTVSQILFIVSIFRVINLEKKNLKSSHLTKAEPK